MKYFFTLLLSIVLFGSHAQIKVVGYLPTYRWEKLEQLDFDHLSHVCAAFANPDESGNLIFEKNLKKFAKVLHENNTKAIVSICGGGHYSWGEKYKVYEKLLETPKSRTDFIEKVVKFVKKNDLDGLDNDMEGKALVLKNYNVLSQELADSLHANDLEYSAALYVGGTWGVDNLTPETMQKHDYIMTMSYGGVGNWNWRQKPDDSNYAKYQKDVNHLITKGYDQTKTIGGLPFYYVEFPQTQQANYSKFSGMMCDLYDNYEDQKPLEKDTLYSPEGNPIYLNSLATYYKKIDLAIENNSGFMIWELGQDCFSGDMSIMKHLAAYMDKKKVIIEKRTEE